MTLLQPIWLLLALPLALLVARLDPGPGPRRFLRPALGALVILALARPAVELPRRAGTVVALVDRSASMPDDAADTSVAAVRRLLDTRSGQQRVAVVSFGDRAVIEHLAGGGFDAFTGEVGRHRSDLGEGLETALALVPPGAPGRVLLLTDARWTGADPETAVARAVAQGIAIDHRLLERPVAGDLAIEEIDAPDEVSPGEGFLVAAHLLSPTAREIRWELRRGDVEVASGSRRVSPGRSRLVLRDRAAEAGHRAYELRIADGFDDDPTPENDTARFLVGVRGPRPVLVVGRPGGVGLAELLRRGGLDVEIRSPGPLDVADLGRASAVVLENVDADALGSGSLATVAEWIRAAGGGLVMTGGQRSFALGGYYRSPLEGVLPVSMELRREHRRLSVAVAIALDRSGSMGAPVAGRTKMDLANLAAAEVLGLLTGEDEIAVLAVDSAPHSIVPLSPVASAASIRERVLRIEAGGGGIYVFEALRAAVAELAGSSAGARHVLLFADAADAEEPGDYRALLDRCRAAGITVSVIGLGLPTDVDAELLRDIAHRGEGRAFFTVDAAELPRLFAQDTFSVVRSAFVEEPTPVASTPALDALVGRRLGDPAPVGGYNLTFLQPGADLLLTTRDEHEAPLAASWRSGLGRVVAFTGEADGEHTGAIAGWAGVGDLWTSLVRWTAGEGNELSGGMLATRELADGVLRVRLLLDPEAPPPSFAAGAPRVRLLRGRPGGDPATADLPLEWTGPDSLEAVVELEGDEVALSTVDVPGAGTTTLAPVQLPYSPEHAPAVAGEGANRLRAWSRATGGRRVVDVGELWGAFPRSPRLLELAPWLFGLALLALLLEVWERRTGAVSSILAADPRRFLQRRRAAALAPARSRSRRAAGPGAAHRTVGAGPAPEPGGPDDTVAGGADGIAPRDSGGDEPEGLGAALGRARARADRRTRR